jgi:hypothetical protein
LRGGGAARVIGIFRGAATRKRKKREDVRIK